MSDNLEFGPESGDSDRPNDSEAETVEAMFNALATALEGSGLEVEGVQRVSKDKNTPLTNVEKLHFLKDAAMAHSRWKEDDVSFAVNETELAAYIALTLLDHAAKDIVDLEDAVEKQRKGSLWLTGAVALIAVASIANIILYQTNLA